MPVQTPALLDPEDPIAGQRRRRQQQPDADQGFHRVDVVETNSHSTLPTDVVLYLAGLDDDDERLARLSKQLARRYEVPPLYLFGTTDPSEYKDPFTGEPLSLKQANRFTNSFAPVAVASMLGKIIEDDRATPTRREAPLRVEQVAKIAKVLSRELGDELPFDKGLALAVSLARRGIKPSSLAKNLSVVRTWADAYGGMTQDEIFSTAAGITDIGKTLTDVRDLKVLMFGEGTVEDREKFLAEQEALENNTIGISPQVIALGQEQEQKYYESQQKFGDFSSMKLGPDFSSEVEEIQAQIRLEQEAFQNSVFGKALGAVGEGFNRMWVQTEKYLVTGGAILQGVGVAALQGIGVPDPQGDTLVDNLRLIQRNRDWAMQRINEGETVGDFVQQGYGLPEWTSPAFDFLVGWYVDPLVIAGKAAALGRAKRVLPGTLEKLTLPGFIASKTPGVRKIWELELAQRALRTEEAWAKAIPDFAASSVSRRLFKDAYSGTTGYFRRIERLRGVYEARGTLDVQYMKALRDKVVQAFPDGGDDAWKAWQDGMVAHFTGSAPEGTIAAEVVQARAQLGFRADGIARDFTYQPKLFEETQSGLYTPNKDGYVQLGDDVIENANGRAILVPGELSVELPGSSWLAEWGPRRAGRALTTSPAFTKTALGRRSSRLINYNPGRVLNFHDAPEQYALLHARRWAQFDEPAVRRFESEAVEIVNSGKRVEDKLTALVERIDRQGFDAMVKPYNLDDGLSEQIFRDIFDDTYRQNAREQVFGVTRAGGKIDAPILESQLKNIAYVTDPIAARQYVRRVISMRTRATQHLSKSLFTGVGSRPISTLDPDTIQRVVVRMADATQDFHRAYLRFWKAFTVARPAYSVRVIGIDENARFLATVGSLTERLISLSLSRSGSAGKNIVARKLDDWFDDVIQVGDEAVTIPRSGAYEYEAMAAGRVRESEMLEEVLRQASVYDKAMKANGGWEVLDAAGNATLHRSAWSHALRKQFRQSAPGRVGLESVAGGDTIEATERALMRWAKEDGYVTLTSRIGVDPTDVELWASDLASMLHSYTRGSPEIAQVALTGSRRAVDHILNRVAVADRPRIHGPSVEQITDGGLMTRTTNRLYGAFVRLPEDMLNRQPFYRVWKQRYDKAALKALQTEGVTLTPAIKEAIDNAGRKFALGQVRRVMFDFTKQSRFTELLQWAFPFPQPFFEGFQAWGHIAWRNPEAIGRGMALWRLGKETGFLRKDPVSGEYMIPLGVFKRPALLVNTLLGGDPELLKHFDMLAPVAGLNMLTSTTLTLPSDGIIGKIFGGVPIPVPGLDPVVAAGLQKIFATTRSRWLSGWLFQYGPTSPLRMVPTQLQAPLRALAPSLFEDESSTAAMKLTVTQAIHQMGLDVDDEGKALTPEQLDTLATDMTEDLMAVRAFTGLITPTAPRFVLEGAAADRELFDGYMEAANQDFFKATESFLADHPDKYFVPASKTNMTGGYGPGQEAPRINASDLVHELYRAPGIGDWMQANPQWAALMLIGTDPALEEEFNFSQFSEQVASGIMRYKTPTEYLNSAQAIAANQEIDAFYTEVWNPGMQALADGGLDETDNAYQTLKVERSEIYRELAAKYPTWGLQNVRPETGPDGTVEYTRAYGVNGQGVPVDKIREDAWQIANTPGISELPGPRALRTYLEGTEDIKDEMAKLRLTDITSERAKEAGLWADYKKVVKDTLTEAPDIEPFLRNYFGVGTDDGEITYTEDLVYNIGESDMEFFALTPEQQDVVTKLDNRIEDLRQATRTGFDTAADRSEAYLKASQFVDKAYRSDPKLIKNWWATQGESYRQQYREGLIGKPVTFYSAFDFAVMAERDPENPTKFTGPRLTKRAGGWLDTIAEARVEIARLEDADPVGYSESGGYEAIDAWVKTRLGKDKSFDAAIKATNTWGWSVEQAGYTKVEGKVGYFWTKLLRVARDIQGQVDRIGLTGRDYGSDAERQSYIDAQKQFIALTQEWRDNSKAFDRSWNEIMEITGEPIIGGDGLLMPDTYFGPMGRVDS